MSEKRTLKEKIKEDMVMTEEEEEIIKSVLKEIKQGGAREFGDLALLPDYQIINKISEHYKKLKGGQKNGN